MEAPELAFNLGKKMQPGCWPYSLLPAGDTSETSESETTLGCEDGLKIASSFTQEAFCEKSGELTLLLSKLQGSEYGTTNSETPVCNTSQRSLNAPSEDIIEIWCRIDCLLTHLYTIGLNEQQ